MKESALSRSWVDPQGRFRARLSLREGDNPVSVSAESVGGQTEEVALEPIRVDSRAPQSKVDASWE